MWTLFLSGFDNGTRLIALSEPNPEVLTVDDVIAKVSSVSGVPASELRLLFGGQEMAGTAPLGDFPGLGDNSTISIAFRLPGGSCHVDPSVRRSTGPCVITYCDYDSPECVVMSCSHSVEPDALYSMCCTEVFSNKKWEIRCPSSGCNRVWPLDEVLRCGITQGEVQRLAKAMSENWCMKNKDDDIRQCPGCLGYCMRADLSNRRVRCINCTQEKKRTYDFCWYCLCEWLGDHRCKKETNLVLQAAPIKDIYGVQCPTIRACPKCGFIIEHAEKCKHMTCSSCKQEFCFVCLSLKQPNETWLCGLYNTKCRPAPKQAIL